MTYYGYDAQTLSYNYGFPNQAFNLTVADATKTTKFTVVINSAAAGADVNSHAFINVEF